MALHPVSPNILREKTFGQVNFWSLTVDETERIGRTVLGPPVVPLLRHGTMRAIIASRKFGSAAGSLVQELALFGDQVRSIRAGGTPLSGALAASFFHLRFENIHPLTDGNGRVGRLLLAAQCRTAFGVDLEHVLSWLQEDETSYRDIFAAPTSQSQYELMVDLVARMVGLDQPTHLELAFPLEPAFPEPNTSPPSLSPPPMPWPQRKGRSAFF